MGLLAALRPNLNWRSFEREGALKHFGKIFEVSQNAVGAHVGGEYEYVRWFPESESTTTPQYLEMETQFNMMPSSTKHINPISKFANVHDKVSSFYWWKKAKIKTPKNFLFIDKSTFRDMLALYKMETPYLLRLNNGVAGYDSFLITEESQVDSALDRLMILHRQRWETGLTGTKMICVEFIDTRSDEIPFNVSYRVIAAGNKVVTGYARVSYPQDWVAVTNKFTPELMDAWYEHNCLLEKRLQDPKQVKEIVAAMKVLGLNHQGIDIIPDGGTGKLHFLEVQTTYDAGFINAGPYVPPYYNPFNPELLKFIEQNKSEMEQTMPLYTFNWLDKRNHFDLAYKYIKEDLDIEQTI